MKNNYLAKSNKETILEHTEKLIKNFKILTDIYSNLNVNKELLLLSCIYHDLGKININFQKNIENFNFNYSGITHGLLSLAFINIKNLLMEFEISDIKALIYSVALHHERDFSQVTKKDYLDEIEKMNLEVKGFNFALEKLKKIFIETSGRKIELFPDIFNDEKLKKLPSKFYKLGERPYSMNDYEIFKKFVMLKGLLNRIDYASSAYIEIEKKNNFLEEELENFKKKLKIFEWNKMQQFMVENRKRNVILKAQTGLGKTEAALLWIGNSKGFFTLPLRSATNSIFERLTNQIISTENKRKIGLLHSNFKDAYIENCGGNESEILKYITSTRQFSLAITICTIDQLFDFVFKAAGFEMKLATLSYSKIVIDEIQMYSPELTGYLLFGLKQITEFGGKFSVITATFPPVLSYFLKKLKINFIESENFIEDKIRHSVKVLDEEMSAEFIDKIYQKNKNLKILVVCNTIKKANEIYEKLNETKNVNINLIHSRFINSDRKKKDKEIFEFASSTESGIWIGTQVIEASLDIDFDVLITELSDLNGLFQRMGRCYRKREFDKKTGEYNCFVFSKRCSGTFGEYSIVDKEIHKKSKEALNETNGLLDESHKIELIEKTYSYESLKNTKYFETIEKTIIFLDNLLSEYSMTGREAQKKLRNIFNEDIIPLKIFEENKEKILKSKEMINQKFENLNEEAKKKKIIEKIKAKEVIENFKVSVPAYLLKDRKTEFFQLSDYETLKIVNCKYTYEKGVEF
jgi:CRISPR-associated helicase cas3